MKLTISYIGKSNSIEVLTISPKAAARRWPDLFAEFAREVAREAERGRVEQLPLATRDRGAGGRG